MSVQNTSQTSVFLGRLEGDRKTSFDCSTVIRDESYPVLAVFYFERNSVLTVVVEVYTKTN
jgi:hypothetical protein